jgi:arabinose-5-phosphate isomerase
MSYTPSTRSISMHLDTSPDKALAAAHALLEIETASMAELSGTITERFPTAATVLARATGRVVTTGIGKSAATARLIASTFSTAGIPAWYLHANDALHGELGSLHPEDALLALSFSGETQEVLQVARYCKSGGQRVVAITGGGKFSSLARVAHSTIHVPVRTEADPTGMLPTVSVLLMLAVGHALATFISSMNGGTKADLLSRHPAGVIGSRLAREIGISTDDSMLVTDKSTSNYGG